MNHEKDMLLAPLTYYKTGGNARDVYFPVSAEEMLDVLRDISNSGTEFFILGGGSNVLIGDGYFNGAVIVTTGINYFSVSEDFITCGAGLESSKVAEIAFENSKTGLEFLYNLPGSIGGAIAGNARFKNINVSDVILSLTAVHPQEGVMSFKSEEIKFAYKFNSLTRAGWYITEASLKWSVGDPKKIKAEMDEIELFRKNAHHFDYPSCGCVFKNDYKHNVQIGKLVESLGLKGYSIGGAKIADFHGNFIINTGNATANDILSIIEFVEKTALEKTGFELEREVRILGNFK
jgi:UDP-N-acetylmuramate dehydrogenase